MYRWDLFVRQDHPQARAKKSSQKAWKVPISVSRWENLAGQAIPLDRRRVATNGRGPQNFTSSNGRGPQNTSINDRVALVAEGVYTAKTHANKDVEQRAGKEQKLTEEDKERKEEGEVRILGHRWRDGRSEAGSEDNGNAHDGNIFGQDRHRNHEMRQHQSGIIIYKGGQILAKEQSPAVSGQVALGSVKPAQVRATSRPTERASEPNTNASRGQIQKDPDFTEHDFKDGIYRPKPKKRGHEKKAGDSAALPIQEASGTDAFRETLPTVKGSGTAEAVSNQGPAASEKAASYQSVIDDGPKAVNAGPTLSEGRVVKRKLAQEQECGVSESARVGGSEDLEPRIKSLSRQAQHQR